MLLARSAFAFFHSDKWHENKMVCASDTHSTIMEGNCFNRECLVHIIKWLEICYKFLVIWIRSLKHLKKDLFARSCALLQSNRAWTFPFCYISLFNLCTKCSVSVSAQFACPKQKTLNCARPGLEVKSNIMHVLSTAESRNYHLKQPNGMSMFIIISCNNVRGEQDF